MAIKVSPQLEEERPQRPERSDFKRRSFYSVRQDNNAPRRLRVASGQALTLIKRGVTRRMDTNSDRGKKHSAKRRTVLAAGWVSHPISEEIDRIARDTGFTRSHIIAVLLEEAVHQKLHVQHAVMLGPIIQQALAKEQEKDRKRMAELLVQNTVLTRQILYLVTHLLSRIGSTHPLTAEQIYNALDWSKQKARENTFKHSPQTEALIAAIGNWLDWEEEGGGERAKGRGST
jgi:hypothetical protein